MLDVRKGSRSGAADGRDGSKRADEGIAPGRRTLVEALDMSSPAVSAPRTETADSTAEPGEQLVAQPAVQSGASPGTTAALPGHGAPTALLSSVQTADAIRYHTSQYWKYTKKVIIEIQHSVGVSETGVMNAETVQAIAARQAAVNAERTPSPLLKVDGKAGPRTLPILIPVGLATDEEIDEYTTSIQGKHDEIAKATTAEDRAALILGEVNVRLEAVKVPPITEPVKLDDGELNEFKSKTWEMTMSRTKLLGPESSANPGSVGASDESKKAPENAAATMYHEARHAEQAFRIARMLRGQWLPRKLYPLDRIATDVPMLRDKLSEDMVPIKPGTTEAVEAQGWHEDEPGHLTNAQGKAKLKATALAFRDAALAAAGDDAKLPQAAAAYSAFLEALRVEYFDNPVEYDAFFVGDKVGDKLGVSRGGPFPSLQDAIKLIVKDPTLGGVAPL